MIKTKPPRPKPAKGGDSGPDGGADKPLKNSGGGGGSGGGSAAKKRRPSQKKKEPADDGGGGGGSRKRSIGGVVLAPSSSSTLHQEEHRRYYQRAPRLLPDIDGVRALSSSEVSADLKLLQSSLNAFEAKLAGHLPSSVSALGGGLYLHGNKATPPTPSSMEDAYAFLLHQPSMKHRRLARPNGVITPEEVVESLPACRRAVRITQRELAAMKRERDDLERDFMRQRNKLLWQMGEMKRIQKQHDRSLQVLSADVLTTAKSLASSRRRTNALQDIMTELDARGNAVVRLTRDKHQLEALLQKHGIPLPEPDEIYVGDRVSGPFGEGRVTAMDDVQRVLTVALDHGKGTAYVQEETVEVLPSEISYADAEKELKAKLFDTIGALVQPHGRFSFLSAASGRRRSRDDQDSDGDLVLDGFGHADADEDDEDEEEEEEEDPTENGLGDGDDEQYAGRRSAADGDLDGNDETEMSRKRPAKKRKLMVPPADKKKKKLQKHSKILDFTAGKIPITPYDVGLLLSPLSVLPERVAAVGPDALQWLSSYLPAKMADWEQDRYHSLQMQGEIERLRFELQKAEDDKEDAHSLAVEQVDSMNDLVRQIEKLREQLAAKELKEKGNNQTCATCSTPSTGSSSKKASATIKQTKSNGRASGSKSSNRRPRSESTEGDDDDADSSGKEDKKKTAHDESDAPEDSDGRKDKGDAHQQEDDDYGDDGGESSGDASKPAARSLRPRRGSGNSTTSQSSATTSTSKAAK